MSEQFDIIKLPNGKVLVTTARTREGFSVPEGVLVGEFPNIETAKEFLTAQDKAEGAEGDNNAGNR